MVETMKAARGVGLAAPQVGVSLRITCIQLPEDYDDPRAGKLLVLCNPEIARQQGEWHPDEGCLSVPGYVANIRRAWSVTVTATDPRGRDLRLKAEGLLSQALQHEIDHLNGVLFLDHLADPRDLRQVAEPEGAAANAG
jgi:peptide deformylase